MQDYLKDIVQHTYSLGCVELVKVVGTAEETVITALAEQNLFLLEAKVKNPVPEFIGTFGMPNLAKLNTILNIPEYAENASLNITYKKDANNQDTPDGIHFENSTGDFKNDYRFMTAQVVNDKLKKFKMKPVPWNVEFTPTVQGIQRLKFMASANSEETTFVAKTENGDLKFSFGDHSSHAGNFVFQSNVAGTVSRGWNWPVAVISILSLNGDKTFKISDEGTIMITVDSGLIDYTYYVLAQTK